jgi:group I intron endonuclease
MINKPEVTEWQVYCWTNLITGQQYFGQSKNIKRRTTQHINAKATKTNRLSKLDTAIKECGVHNFSLTLLDKFPTRALAVAQEETYIHICKSLYPRGYNVKSRDMKEDYSDINSKIKQGQRPKESGRKYLGVSKCYNRFGVTVSDRRVKIRKSFPSEIEAAEAYDKMVLFLYGSNATLNFPERRKEYLFLDLTIFYNDFVKPLDKTCPYKWVAKVESKSGIYYVVRQPKRSPTIILGHFSSEIECARMADKMYFALGKSPIEKLNFPDEAVLWNKNEMKVFFESKKFSPTSFHRGIHYSKGRWTVRYYVNGSRFHIGDFKTEAEAVMALTKTKNFFAKGPL